MLDKLGLALFLGLAATVVGGLATYGPKVKDEGGKFPWADKAPPPESLVGTPPPESPLPALAERLIMPRGPDGTTEPGAAARPKFDEGADAIVMSEANGRHVASVGSFLVGGRSADDCKLVAALANKSLKGLGRYWRPQAPEPVFEVQCRVVLCYSVDEYRTEAKTASGQCVGYSYIERRTDQGKIEIVGRKIVMMMLDREATSTVVPHEVAHQYLGFLMGGKRIPRWLDEGFAVQAEDPVIQDRFLAQLKAVGWAKSEELMKATSYPSDPDKNGAFYGQSVVSLQFLLWLGGTAKSNTELGRDRFLKFAEDLCNGKSAFDALKRYNVQGWKQFDESLQRFPWEAGLWTK